MLLATAIKLSPPRIPALGAGARSGLVRATVLAALLLALGAGTGQAQGGGGPPAPAGAVAAQLAFIEQLYQEGDGFRAESEVLRFVQRFPGDPGRTAAELARAKLYYRDGRYGDARLMLYALLDHDPPQAVRSEARRLLTFAHLRLGQTAQAAETLDALALPGQSPPDPALLAPLRLPPAQAVDVDAAVTWSTWLPGSGYFLLGEPGKAVTGLSLNLLLLGATALAVQRDNLPAAGVFLLLEGLLWQGGRSGVRQDGEAYNARLSAQRLEQWLVERGEGALLRVGVTLRFGGG